MKKIKFLEIKPLRLLFYLNILNKHRRNRIIIFLLLLFTAGVSSWNFTVKHKLFLLICVCDMLVSLLSFMPTWIFSYISDRQILVVVNGHLPRFTRYQDRSCTKPVLLNINDLLYLTSAARLWNQLLANIFLTPTRTLINWVKFQILPSTWELCPRSVAHSKKNIAWVEGFWNVNGSNHTGL